MVGGSLSTLWPWSKITGPWGVSTLHAKREHGREVLLGASVVILAFLGLSCQRPHPQPPNAGVLLGKLEGALRCSLGRPPTHNGRAAQTSPQWAKAARQTAKHSGKGTCLGLKTHQGLESSSAPPRHTAQEKIWRWRGTHHHSSAAPASGPAAGCPDPGLTHRDPTDRQAPSPDFPWKQGGSRSPECPRQLPCPPSTPPKDNEALFFRGSRLLRS